MVEKFTKEEAKYRSEPIALGKIYPCSRCAFWLKPENFEKACDDGTCQKVDGVISGCGTCMIWSLIDKPSLRITITNRMSNKSVPGGII